MSTMAVNPDVSQCVFEFLHAEVVEYFLKKQSSNNKSDVIESLEHLGHRVGESMVERTSRDTPRFRTELDAVVFICKQFWYQAFNKQIDNLKTNHQDTYVLHDYNFRLLAHVSHSEQYKDEAPLYMAFSCGLVHGALSNLGIRCQVSAEPMEMPASDLEAHAAQVLDRNAWGYYSSGADAEQTLRDNQAAFSRYRLRPRVLVDVSKVDTRVELFGEWIDFPICVAPTAMQRMAHHDGEIATAKACANFGTCMTLSSWSTVPLEEVAQANSNGLRWFQLYVYKDRALTKSLVKRAEEAGYKALVITVDTPVLGRRKADIRNRFTLPPHFTLANFSNITASNLQTDQQDSGLHTYTQKLIDPSLSWETVDWLRGVTSLPIVLKGIVTREDAKEALRHDVQGILVSNHGARQLDGVPATIDALTEVVEGVEGKIDVFLDGGVRHGSDAFKALAMGAKTVFIGRPVLWGLAYDGQAGVERVLQLLRDEFQRTMRLSGCQSVAELQRELVVHESYYQHYRARL